MSVRLSILLAAALPAAALAQTPLPPDINPVTLSRLPPVTRGDLDAEGQRLLDARTNPAAPGPGPGHITSYSPKIGEGLGREHKVSSELWAKMTGAFGRQRTIESMALMGDYFIVGMMMNAADQHLPPTRQPLLPALKQ
jgi:hypothetical protein